MATLHDLPIRRKLTLLTFAVSAAMLVIVGVAFTLHAAREARSVLRGQLATQATIVSFTVAPALVFRDEAAAAEALSALRAEEQVEVASVYTPDGTLFASYARGESPVRRRLAEVPPAGTERFDYRAGTVELSREVRSESGSLGTLYLRADLTGLRRSVRDSATITAAVLLASLVAALVVGGFLQRVIARPILELAATARVVAVDRDYTVRARSGGSGELGSLVAAFNEMLEGIQERDTRLRSINRELKARTDELARKNEEVEAFVYIVSHDLRGPLVNLQGFGQELARSCDELSGRLSALELPAPTATEIEELIDVDIANSLRFIAASTAKFERLIDALLRLSRSGRTELVPETVDMAALAATTVDSMRKLVEAKGAVVSIGELPPAWGDATAIGQVLANLLTNALRYLEPSRPGRIDLGGAVDDESTRYFVRDNGVGIAEEARERLFRVFQRLRPDLAEGEGIGLAMVKRIIERHGGRVWVESSEGSGTTFLFALPSREHTEGRAP